MVVFNWLLLNNINIIPTKYIIFVLQDNDVIIRVEKLLSQKQVMLGMTQLTVSSSCEDDENGNADTVTVIRLVATGKRALSDSYSSCEPIPKKLRVGMSKHNDTTSTNSYCSDD